MKKNFYLVAFMLSLASLPVLSTAQSLYLEPGERGILVSGFIDDGEEHTKYGGQLGYSFNGILDLGISIGQQDHWEYSYGETMGNFIEPFLSYLVIKKSSCNSYELTINSMFNYTKYSSKSLDSANVKMTSVEYSIELELSREFQLSANWSLIPLIGSTFFGQVETHTKVSPHGAWSKCELKNSFEYGFTIARKTFGNKTIFLSNIFINNESDQSLKTTLGFVF
jgi:hypothetical protein